MAQVYKFVDANGETRLLAEIDPPPGLPSWFQSGSGAPVGTVTPSQKGALYQDTTNGGLFVAIGATSASWVQVGGAGPETIAGVLADAFSSAVLGVGSVFISDVAGANNSGNGVSWNTNSAPDGNQTLRVQLGSTGQFVHTFGTDGSYTAADGGIVFPSADPHVFGAWWDNSGTLTRSSG